MLELNYFRYIVLICNSIDPASFASPKTHSWASGYDFIRKELENICPTDEVEKDHIIKLCTKLQLDAQDEQVLSDYSNMTCIMCQSVLVGSYWNMGGT